MRYFDRVLSETLAATVEPADGKKTKPEDKKRKTRKVLKGELLYDEMKRIMNLAGKEGLDQLEREKYWAELHKLKTEDNAEQFRKCFDKIAEENKGNKHFQQALTVRAHMGDNLVLWMLRYLIHKAESG